jgi:hypothetical protein
VKPLNKRIILVVPLLWASGTLWGCPPTER